MEKKILVVGAGYAGILAAKKLAKKFKKSQEVSVTIIDKNPFHTMLTELHEVAAGRVDESSIRVDLKRVFAGRKITVLQDTIQAFDYENKQIQGEHGAYSYDVLVLASGSKPSFYGITGAEEHAFRLWSYADAVRLKEHILGCFRRASMEPAAEKKRLLLSFIVVGAGFTGVEMAGELGEYLPVLCGQFEIDPTLVSLRIVDMLPTVMPNLPAKLSSKATRRLKKLGVELILSSPVVSIDANGVEAGAAGQVRRFTASTVIWTAGIQISDAGAEAGKSLGTHESGRIKVNPYLQAEGRDEVFVIGDNMFYIPPGSDKPVPQMVENCEHSSHLAAKNIAAMLSGKGKIAEYRPAFHGVMISVGGRYGVARVGFPGLMFNLPSFFAMLVKHLINMVYFIQLLGWNKIASYTKHEFFTIRNRRSFLGGHFSNRTPSFLLVPLRVWLGLTWIWEAILKYNEGWLDKPMLKEMFAGVDKWFESLLTAAGADVTTAATAAGDAVSGATGAAGAAASAGEVIFNWNILGLFDAVLVSAQELTHATFSDLAFKLDVPLMDWFVATFITSGDGIQVFMQTFIIVAEILIGLALIGGLFTFPATAFSLILQVMFVCTTGLYLSSVWMVAASVAVLFGAGHIFGLDYYVAPALKRWWKRLPCVKRTYVYND